MGAYQYLACLVNRVPIGVLRIGTSISIRAVFDVKLDSDWTIIDDVLTLCSFNMFKSVLFLVCYY